MENINARTGRKIVTGWFSPDFGFEKDPEKLREVVTIIKASDANVLAVGLGAPKQEKWIFANKDKLEGIKIFLAIGATIDFEAGNVKRAPAFYRNNSLEWLYRMFAQPRRLIKRYLVDDLPIFTLIYRQKKGRYRDPFAR
jgi:exopolysaccharide biosynthesis WecB/TagA/CpsF family protein